MKQTAVEWLVDELQKAEYIPEDSIIMDYVINEAKEMEKQQIENAYWDGGQDVPLTEKTCEEYYNETFKSE
jgi:hypothetical protein